MTFLKTFRAAAAIAACLAAASLAQSAELGMTAPPLQIESWVQGKPLKLSDGADKTVHVVEFWATWCGPCRVSIPHLSELQEKYKDKATFIGVSDEPAATIKPFVTKMGDQMKYRVAADKDRATYDAYMGAFGENGIPHAFIVDKAGKIAWHGHPMSGMEEALKEIIAGTYNIAAAKKSSGALALAQRYLTIASTGNALSPEAKRIGDQVVEDGGSNSGLMSQFAWIILTHPRITSRDLDLAAKASRTAYMNTKGEDPRAADTYAKALSMKGNFKEAIRVQQEAVARATDPQLKEKFAATLKEYEAQPAAK